MVSKIFQSKGGIHAPLFLFLRSSSGFTMVELMVVVGIIGLLSAVAIPNFQKFQARSRTTEAKLQLAAVYTAEASFYGSYHMYHSCLNYMGYDPREFQNTRFYSVGFMNTASIHIDPFTSSVAGDLNVVDCPQSLPATANSTYFLAGNGVGGNIAGSNHIPATSLGDQTIGQMTFVAGAGGVIHKAFTGTTDSSAFTIDQVKKISTVRTGY